MIKLKEEDMENPKKQIKDFIIQSLILLFTGMAIVGTPFCADVFAQPAHETETTISAMSSTDKAEVTKFGLLAAAIAFGLGAIGAGIAIAHVGAAAMGAIAEKPEIAGQALIFVALAEGLVIFGFITALMILGKV